MNISNNKTPSAQSHHGSPPDGERTQLGLPYCRQPMASILLPVRGDPAVPNSNPHGQRVHWVGMTPLDWIDSLTQASNGQYSVNSVPCVTSNLPQPFLCNEISGSNSGSKSTIVTRSTSRSHSAYPDSISSSTHPTTKSPFNPPPHHEYDNQAPKYFWDVISYIDSMIGAAASTSSPSISSLSSRIRQLSLLIESQPNFHSDLELSYTRVHDHCLSIIDGLRRQHQQQQRQQVDSSINPKTTAMTLQHLGEEIVHKFQALLDMSQKLQAHQQNQPGQYFPATCQSNPTTSVMTMASPPRASMPKTDSLANSPLSTSSSSSTSGAAAQSVTSMSNMSKKQELSKYMTKWLHDNWTNPYPDDSALQQMSRECGSTTTVVSNWLINARTRKWRPAIVKAYDMNRPAAMLLEDSINIFSGKPVRKLDEDTDHQANSSHEVESCVENGGGNQFVVSSSSSEEEDGNGTGKNGRRRGAKSPNKRARMI